jgi:hypothetical protein
MIKKNITYFQKMLIGFMLVTIPYVLFADNFTEGEDLKRLLIGIDFFPSFLASDQDIASKTGSDNQLHIVLIYQYNKSTADDMANRLGSLGKIRGIPINVNVLSVTEIDFFNDQPIAGIFITESMISLASIIKKSIENHFIVFSPFEGDVEKGVTGGIFITERILPYINQETLCLAKIKMKSFFLKVSKKYE